MIKFLGTAQKEDKSLLFYNNKDGELDKLKVVDSQDGFEFGEEDRYVIVTDDKDKQEKNYNWKSFRISKQEDKYFLTYKLDGKKNSPLLGAISTDLVNFQKTGEVDHITETGSVVPDFIHRQNYLMYFGETNIKIAYSPFLYNWKTLEKPVLESRKNSFDEGNLEVGNAFKRSEGILLTYYVKGKSGTYSVGAAIFDEKEPSELLWRAEAPIWEFSEEYQYAKIQPLGSVIIRDELVLYWLVDDASILAVSTKIPDTQTRPETKVFSTSFKKTEKNPIISPIPNHPWESRATFNSAAIYADGRVHFIYRALGDSDLSVFGYATSADGIHIDERLNQPIYIPREPFETPGQQVFKTFADHFASGGGYGGVEDPRITKIDNKLFMTYVAFDGANPPRVALTSISYDDFLNRRWEKWEKPKLISAPGMVNKNAIIFPEKVKGKYVVFHRIYPNILVDYVDDLSFENTHLQGQYFIPPRKKYWDSKKIGAGAPPIKTEDGWLFIYQAVGHQEPHKYKIGAMLLDLENPTKVLFRTNSPIIEPVENYENDGFKAGVVYPCGAVAVKDNLHVYYGGADTVVCAATADLPNFLKDMKRNKEPKMKMVKSNLFN